MEQGEEQETLLIYVRDSGRWKGGRRWGKKSGHERFRKISKCWIKAQLQQSI